MIYQAIDVAFFANNPGGCPVWRLNAVLKVLADP